MTKTLPLPHTNLTPVKFLFFPPWKPDKDKMSAAYREALFIVKMTLDWYIASGPEELLHERGQNGLFGHLDYPRRSHCRPRHYVKCCVTEQRGVLGTALGGAPKTQTASLDTRLRIPS